MRKITQEQYDKAKAALAAYAEYCKPYVGRNGWTVIPADAPAFIHDGAPVLTHAINAFSTTVELFEFERDKPAKFSAYVHEADSAQRYQTNFIALQRRTVSTWTGEPVGLVTQTGAWHRNNMGGKWRAVRAKSDWGKVYYGREYDSRQLVNFREVRA